MGTNACHRPRTKYEDALKITAAKEIWATSVYHDEILGTWVGSPKMYRWNGASWNPGWGTDGRDIAIADDGNLWLTNTSGIVYHYNATTKRWEEICGSSAGTISSNKNKVMMVNTSGRIYKLTY